MQQSMYSALFGALTQEHRLNIIANNLANVNTVGFKKDKLAFKDVFYHYAHDYINPNEAVKSEFLWPKAKDISQTRIAYSRIDFNQGAMRRTGNVLDLAIEGEGFFKVKGPDGKTYYTRNGNFFRHPRTGEMITNQGFTLIGRTGNISLPETGKIDITEDGNVLVDGKQVGEIEITTFDDLNVLQKVGRQLFQIKPGLNVEEKINDKAWIKQGYLEDSNVEVVQEMVGMIDTLRTFESLQKIMTTTQEEDQKVIREVGTVR
ncbi:flagellar basal-body rod protein FlgF [Desulfovulcanus sp.]